MGLKEFFNALQESGLDSEVKIIHRAFQLDPNAPKDSDEANEVVIARKYNKSVEEVRQSQKSIQDRACSLGLEFNSELIRPANTATAHRISKYAHTLGKELEWINGTMRAFFG
ncbi:hypothetical protein GKC56_06790 [Neisseriaceae bacterium PsAf]|nr:hypothetical protein [Neisseriaceae bacterium PsAf]